MTHPGQVLGPDTRADISWRISSYSPNGGGSCVEAGSLPDTTGRIAVRHSHHPDDRALVISQTMWTAFIDGVKKAEFGPAAS